MRDYAGNAFSVWQDKCGELCLNERLSELLPVEAAQELARKQMEEVVKKLKDGTPTVWV